MIMTIKYRAIHKILFSALIGAAFLLLLPAHTHALEHGLKHSRDTDRPEYVPGEILVKFRQDTGDDMRRATHSKKQAKRIRKFRRSGVEHVKLPEGMSVEDAVSLYMADPMVEYAGPNRLRYTTVLPDDTRLAKQWSLDNAGDSDIDAPKAWNMTTGDNTIVIAVLDTGVDVDHTDLAANIWVNPGEAGFCSDGVDNDGNGYIDDCNGWDFVDNDKTPSDYAGHGTLVAGIIGAVTDNTAGIAGVMWQVKIMPLRFLDSTGSGPVADEIEAIEYAIDNGAIVLNASFGAYGSDTLEESVIRDFCSSGGIFVAAAGNDGTNNDFYPQYPSSYSSSCVISVAATDQDDHFTWFSNYGTNSVHLAAPGLDIESTIPLSAIRYEDYFDGFSGWVTDGGADDNWGVDATGCRYGGNTCLQDSPDSNYTNNLDTWARSKNVIDLSTNTGCYLTYLNRYSVDTDNFLAEASADASTWSILSNSTGTTSGAFVRAEHDVSAFDGGDLYVRFRLVTDASTVSKGVYVENMQVRCDGPGARYSSESGTSFAAPIVSGIAGLVIAKYPTASASSVKNHVVNSAEVFNTLEGWLISGGRANAANALLPIPRKLSATLEGDSSAKIKWKDTTGEGGYRIDRMGPWETGFSKVASLNPNKTSYTDTDLSSGTYSYRVRTTMGGNYSGYARTVSVSIPGGSGGSDSPCFIATAAWGRPEAPEVAALRRFRDQVLIKSPPGRQFVAFYNLVSPPMAGFIAQHPALRAAVRSVLSPAVYLGEWGITHPARGIALLLTGMIITIGISGGISRRRRP
ncbi:MAG: S8 family serine peptidase [Thermodesulfovibrionales bacterium]|nr:S8 family serine peptidase [Thermodesulfovibrionales bacterium]